MRGREQELTEPAVLFEGLGFQPGPGRRGRRRSTRARRPSVRASRPGDRVLRGNGEPIEGWEQWVEFVRSGPARRSRSRSLRGGRELALHGDARQRRRRTAATFGRIGARGARSSLAEQRYGVLESLPRAVEKTWEMITFTVSMLGAHDHGRRVAEEHVGPAVDRRHRGRAAPTAGLAYFLSFLAAVSISLGILNLLPIPLLDGGQIVYQLAEWIKGAPLSERAMVLGQQIGIFFVIALTGFAFYNDIVRIFGS